LLTFIGVRMIREGFEGEPSGVVPNALHILPIIVLSFATSIDALAVGFTFAALAMEIVFSSLIIAGVSFGFSVFGVLLGDRLAGILGRKVEIAGGIVLIAIGLRILLQSFLV
ncbi:MAG TPA: manganese efflux pump, partial [Methanomicrobiales archaeon]|nr:manganese efflux pump [Methanomicrobiales archaeon]